MPKSDSMFQLSVSTNAGRVAELMQDLGKDVERAARIAAVNQTMTAITKDAKARITAATYVKPGIIGKRMKLYRASQRRQWARLFVGIQDVPAIQMGAKETKQGVIWAGGAKGRGYSSRGFIAKMPDGYRGAFERVTPETKRLPIRQLKVSVREQITKIMHRLMANEAPAMFRRIVANEFTKRMSVAVAKRQLKA